MVHVRYVKVFALTIASLKRFRMCICLDDPASLDKLLFLYHRCTICSFAVHAYSLGIDRLMNETKKYNAANYVSHDTRFNGMHHPRYTFFFKLVTLTVLVDRAPN